MALNHQSSLKKTVCNIWFAFLIAFFPFLDSEANDKSVNQPSPVKVGAATAIITPPIGSWQQGAGVTRKGERIRDELEANAIYLGNDNNSLLLISCDLVGLEFSDVKPIREAISDSTGIPPRQVIITCTHTHSGPSLIRTNYYFPIDRPYLKQLKEKLVEVSDDAIETAKPAKIGWGKGEAQIGYNRRLCWADGTHSMHGNSRRSDFAGIEGPDDPAHLAIFVVDLKDKPIAVIYHNTSHPTSFYGGGLFSSDYPDTTRKILRHELGRIPVLYFNGAQGDIAMKNQLNPGKEKREEQLERIGKLLATETLRLYRQTKYHSKVVLGHTFEDLKIRVRLPEKEDLENAKKVLAKADSGKKLSGQKLIFAFGAVNLQERFGNNPVDTLPIHVVRIGEVALVTQPCELYCQFGLDIKRRSPAKYTAVVGLADGYGGYCPTISAILGGGYSGKAISWTRLEPYAGYRMVESAGPMLNQLWCNKK